MSARDSFWPTALLSLHNAFHVCSQAHEKLRQVQHEHEALLRQQLVSTTRLSMLEAAKGEAEAEARKAAEGRTVALTELATQKAVAGEKQRAAEARAAELQVRCAVTGRKVVLTTEQLTIVRSYAAAGGWQKQLHVKGTRSMVAGVLSVRCRGYLAS
jgi:hypothetical protein